MSPMDAIAGLFGANVAAPSDWLWAMEENARGRYFAASREASAPAPSQAVTPEVYPGGVAVVPIRGVMVRDRRYGEETSTPAIAQAVRAAGADPAVGAVVLLADSPGGSVAGLEELGEAVDAVAAVKPVVTQTAGMACSACYEIACHTEAIYARRDHLVGSIGTRLMVYDWSQLFENLGVAAHAIDTGELKSTGALGTKLSDPQRAYLQEIVDEFQASFLASVAKGRGLGESELAAVATGRVWTGRQAAEHGLVDGVQGLDETIAQLTARLSRDQQQSTPSRTRSSTMSETATPEPKAATLAELKQQFPESSAEWRERQLEAENTLAEARLAYAEHRAEEAEARAAEAEERAKAAETEREQQAEAAAPKRRGNAAPAASHEQADGGDVDYRQLARDYQLKNNCRWSEACLAIKRRHPAARAAFGAPPAKD